MGHICNTRNTTLDESILEQLPDNQGGAGRHKCVFCAYLTGVRLKMNKEILTDEVIVNEIENLPERQAGDGRHKCAETALKLGYNS